MRVALYARVSTAKRKGGDAPADERDYQQNPALQLEPMRAYAEAHGWTIAGPVDPDHGRCYFDRASGADASRPQFNRMLEDAGRKKFDVVMCWKFDRISRGTLHLLQTLEALDTAGVGFVSLTEKVDTTTPMGRAMFGIIAVLAQFEREQIQERIRAGITSARNRGAKFGRPRVMVPVLLLQQDMEEGMSLTAAAKKRGVIRTTAARYLALQTPSPKVPGTEPPKPQQTRQPKGPEPAGTF